MHTVANANKIEETQTNQAPNLPKNEENALITISIAFLSIFTLDKIITKAVKVHNRIVSTKTSKIPRHPCPWLFFVSVEAWAQGDVPHPASLERTPRLIPYLIAKEIEYPNTPPQAEFILNAFLNIVEKTEGISFPFINITSRQTEIYRKESKGIKSALNEAIFLLPPFITTKHKMAKIIPNISLCEVKIEETALICTKFPVVNEFKVHKMAKIRERIIGILLFNFFFSPYFM